MFDHTVYNALNGCNETGLERLYSCQILPDGGVIRVYLDNFGQYRAVVFKSEAHSVGYSGVLLNTDGSVRWMHTALHMRGKATTRQLCCYMSSIGIKWRISEHLTDAGKACYK